ncbi:Transient receptor putative cation channel sub A member 1 [Bulinus truncatus]|nr:Transient receptor putative cation channel sub A member 1 [Bulinus truncatus]
MTGKKLPGTSLPSKLASHLRRRRHSDTSLEGGEGVLEMMADLVTHPGDLPIFGRVKPSESMAALNISLHQCARDGDESNMRVLLRSLGLNVKKKINQYDEDGLTPLHYAARYNHLSVVKVLVDAGADVQATGPDRITPLHHAVRYRRERITKKKPVAGKTLSGSVPSSPAHEIAPLDEEDERYIKANRVRKNRNVPSLQTVAAAKSEQVLQHIGMNGGPSLPDFQERDPDGSIVRYLVNRGADINARDVYGQTPLHFAAMRGNEVACNNLLFFKDKIKINSSDSQGSTPLHTAAIHKHNEIARMLIEAGASLMSRDKELCTPLHHAATGGSIDLVTLLLDAGFNSNEGWIMLAEMVSAVDIEQNTPLHVAVDHGHYDVVKVLIDKGADVNKERKHFMYPLHLAAQSGDVRIAKLLLENNARIDALNDEQATALHRAAALNHVQVVAFLAEKGAKIINKRDKDNYTPLLLAAFYGNVETVDLLLRKGADYTAVDKYDKTAIFLAAEKNHLNVLTKLLADPRVKRLVNDSDCYDNDPIHIAAQKGYLEVVQLLLKNGAYLDTKNEEELTPLHCAAKYGRTNIVRELIKHDKTIVNHEDENSNTALHVAARYGHHKVAKVLLGLGADVSSRNYNRWTPLDLAASKGWTKTCLVLLNGGSPIDPTDKHKVTSLHLACTYGHARVAEMLIEWGANVGMKDDEGRNCLDRAIENNQVNVAKVIINSTSWKDALRSATRDPITGSVDTPLRKLIKHMPEIAQRVFDRCLSYGHEKNPERPEYEITFDYEFLDDVYAPWIAAVVKEDEVPPSGENAQTPSESNYGDDDEDDRLPTNAQPYSRDTNILKKNHPLYIMILSERESLLAHPLATSLLQYKWNKFGSFFYYLSFCIYLVFLIFLTGFMISTDPPYMYDNEDTVLIKNNTCSSLVEKYKQPPFATGGFYVILILAAFNMLKELLQIYQAKLNYLGWTNLIEWGIYMSAVLLVINFNDCQRATGYRLEWQWNMGAITLFLGWFELVLLIQKFPRFGIYVVMFTDVLHTFSQFFVVFFLFIIAFALAFFTLLQKQFPFETVSKSIIKTSVMLIGEFEFDDIYNSKDSPLLYPVASYIIFVIFLIIMSIIIMNLLVGLAVDDIKAVQEQAALKRMAMRVELALDVERLIPHFIRVKAFSRRRTLRPNVTHSNPIRRAFTSSYLSPQSLQKALNPELSEIEKVKTNQDRLSSQMRKVKQSVKGVKEQSQKLESMLKAIVKAQKIEWQEEDYQLDEDVELSEDDDGML